VRRRTAIGLLASAASAASLTLAADKPGRARGANAGFEPANPAHVALAFRKPAWSMDESLTFQWLHGTRYGVQGSLLTPFWEMHVGTWFRAHDLGGGRYEVRSAGANFYTQPGVPKLLEKFHNPYTDETVDIPYAAPRATTATYDSQGHRTFDDIPGMKTTSATDIGPAWVQGNEVSVRADVTLRAEPLDARKRSLIAQDMSTWIGSLADVMNPNATNPPSRHMFNDILDYPAYLKMGDQPGTYFSRCHGRKVYRYGEMPARWRALFEAKFADAARDPDGVLHRG
jgi:hypothetical protein